MAVVVPPRTRAWTLRDMKQFYCVGDEDYGLSEATWRNLRRFVKRHIKTDDWTCVFNITFIQASLRKGAMYTRMQKCTWFLNIIAYLLDGHLSDELRNQAESACVYLRTERVLLRKLGQLRKKEGDSPDTKNIRPILMKLAAGLIAAEPGFVTVGCTETFRKYTALVMSFEAPAAASYLRHVTWSNTDRVHVRRLEHRGLYQLIYTKRRCVYNATFSNRASRLIEELRSIPGTNGSTDPLFMTSARRIMSSGCT